MNPTLAFGLLAALMVAATLAALLPGLWRQDAHDDPQDPHDLRKGPRGPRRAPDAGIVVLREQLAALDGDIATAQVDATTAQRLRAEISRRLLEERAGDAPAWQAGPARGVALVLAAGLCVLAAMLYGAFGQPAALDQAPRVEAGPQATQTQVEAMASQMLQALQAREAQGLSEPSDAGAWAMVGRTLASLQRFAEAEQAFARGLALRPDDPSLLADRADLLALLQGTAEGEPLRLIEKALRIAPDHPKALALARQHMPQAAAGAGPDGARLRTPAQAPAQTSPRLVAGPGLRVPSIQGQVSLAPSLRAQVRPSDTVFIVARAAQGPRMPLAILQLRVADLPARFTLDDNSAMDPALRLSRFHEVVVTARISRAGEALPRSGDPIGAPVQAALGARDLALRIDRLQP